MFDASTDLCALFDVAGGALLVIFTLVFVNCAAALLRDALTIIVIHCAALLLGEDLKEQMVSISSMF